MAQLKVDDEKEIPELTDKQENIKSQATIHRILDKLFKIYSDSDEFKMKINSYGYEERSLLLTVVKEPLQGIDIHEVALTSYNSINAVRFGSRFHKNRLEQFQPKEISSFTVQCLMDQDVFIDLLLGKDRYGNEFDINDAWGRKWIGFEGENWLVHKEILADMFTEFRYLLNIKTIFK